MHTAHIIKVQESSQIGEARRIASSFATSIGLSDTAVNRVALIVTEMGSNLVKHTRNRGGEILLQESFHHSQIKCLEIISLDQGPGIENISRAMQDGFSTTGTSGAGLGGIKRLSSFFDVFSRPGLGTAVLSQVTQEVFCEPEKLPCLNVGGICVPVEPEKVSGDLWALRNGSADSSILVSDGLGHGFLANEASLKAIRAFEEKSFQNLGQLFLHLHQMLKQTRGAAISALIYSCESRLIRYMGIGNVSAAIVTPGKVIQMVSFNGIVGHELRKLQEFSYFFPVGALLVLYSDGLTTKWDIEKYPGLYNKHPSLIASVLYRDFRRIRDDVTVVVAKGLES